MTDVELDVRVTVSEENIQGIKTKKVKFIKKLLNQLVTYNLFLIIGLQMTDVELDARITALEDTDLTNGKCCAYFLPSHKLISLPLNQSFISCYKNP